MEDKELVDIWKNYDRAIEDSRVLNLQSWAVNLLTFEYLQTHKAKSRLRALANFKTWAVLLGILWVLFLAVLVYGNHFKNFYFSFSVSAILVFSIIAIAVYIKHIVLINQINLSESTTEVQKKLAELLASTLNIGRILWLQLPFYTTFFWNSKWIASDIKFWLIPLPVTLLFTFLAIWLYRNIAYQNDGKKWFRILFSSREWTSVIKAMDYLKEIEEFKKG